VNIPSVSVICIFHDEQAYIAEAIESVVAQDFGDYELILVDDGSTDRSSDIAKRYAADHSGRIFYLEHPGHANLGMSAARNLGLGKARGRYVAMMDGDDCWIQSKLSEQVAILEANPDVGMVCGGYIEWKSWAGGTDQIFLAGPVANGKTFPPDTTLAVYPLGRACNPTDPIIAREVVERVGGYETSFRTLYEDQAFLSKVFLETGVYWSARAWLKYRRHPESCTMRISAADYTNARREFLDWFSDYIARRNVPHRRKIERSIARARWELQHRTVYGLTRKVRVALLEAARVLGFETVYRQYRHGG